MSKAEKIAKLAKIKQQKDDIRSQIDEIESQINIIIHEDETNFENNETFIQLVERLDGLNKQMICLIHDQSDLLVTKRRQESFLRSSASDDETSTPSKRPKLNENVLDEFIKEQREQNEKLNKEITEIMQGITEIMQGITEIMQGITEIMQGITEIKQLIKSEKSAKSFSKISDEDINSIFQYYKIKAVRDIKYDDFVDEDFQRETADYSVKEFEWTDFGSSKTSNQHIFNEVADTPDAILYIKECLNSELYEKAFKITDCHSKQNYGLSLHSSSNSYTGIIDAFIDPYNHVTNFGMRVVFEFKTSSLNEKHLNQAYAELLSSNIHSYEPVLLVLTNLRDQFWLLTLKTDEQQEFTNIDILKLNNARQAFISIKFWLCKIGMKVGADSRIGPDYHKKSPDYFNARKLVSTKDQENKDSSLFVILDDLDPADRYETILELFNRDC